jgi:prolipoprotein diacylglyceryltransferase
LRGVAERVANTWPEWRVGPIRILGYGFWAAAANFAGLTIVFSTMGPGHVPLVFATGMCGILGALLWAQLIERPAPQARPYGYYGGVFGVIMGACVLPGPTWQLLAGFSCAAPLVQSLGRVRCLMQGCCHGAPAPEGVGIRHVRPLSRVCKAGLSGVPVHPTALYSILWNAVIALFVWRLWSLHAPAHLVCGVYLILAALGRFVEESYRGEPQTPVVAGLRIYQWVAVATLVGGAAITALATSAPLPSPQVNGIGIAALFGGLTWLAMGVDFPGSTRRFARLA